MTKLELTESAYPVSALAQAPDADLLTLVAWCTVLVGALVALVLGIRMARRWFLEEDPADGWTLQDLRDMRERGELTAAQFERLRAEVIGGWTSGGEDGSADSALEETGRPGDAG
ncbi:MAG: SHOCT domain-containing protein [Planctomycetes bacterium]|nr:SHOCT domain-containing protein [Planctomycetota bacterium]